MKKLDIGIRKVYCGEINMRSPSYQIHIPSEKRLTKKQARQLKLELQIAWDLYCLAQDKLEDKDAIPIAILDVIDALKNRSK